MTELSGVLSRLAGRGHTVLLGLLPLNAQHRAVHFVGKALGQNIRPNVDRMRALVAHGLSGFRWGSPQKFDGSFFEHARIVIAITSAA